MGGSKFGGKVNMNGLHVEKNLFMGVDQSLIMRKVAHFDDEVDLINAKIGYQLNMAGSKFCGKLSMAGLQVGSELIMNDGAQFKKEMALVSAKIEGQLDMCDSKFYDRLDMDCLKVGTHLFMYNAEFKKPIHLYYAEIGVNLFLHGSTLNSLDLTGASIIGDFQLGLEESFSKWKDGAKLTLRNTEVGALQDHEDACPDDVELVGFTYSRLGGFEAGDRYSMAGREVKWMINWLEKQKPYSPQPYQQLAKILTEAGHKPKANDVLYAGKKRELKESNEILNQIKLFFLDLFVGYGYRTHYLLYWVGILTTIGVIFLDLSGQGIKHDMPYGIAYSLDMLLPIIKLRKYHYDIVNLVGLIKYYFYFQQIMGYYRWVIRHHKKVILL